MKFYVMGFVFNAKKDSVLLTEKRRPEWQAKHWNGMGGKIKSKDKSPMHAMRRETEEEIGVFYDWKHCVTFVCPGGTVFVFKAVSEHEEIMFDQLEDEQLRVWPLNGLPENMTDDLRWIIPVCLSTVQFPLVVQQNTLGVYNG